MTPNNNLSILPFYKVTTANPRPIDSQKWWAYGDVWPLVMPGIPPFQVKGAVGAVETWTHPPLGGGSLVSTGYPASTKTVNGDTYSYFAGSTSVGLKGRYQLETQINGELYVSDVFTIIDTTQLSTYLKIEWWDDNDFVMDGGVIVYNNSGGVNAYKNVLYLPTDLAKPDYPFSEEGEDRDGYFFPIKQISQKRYRFSFLAPEYICDVMRFIRMSDHIKITYRGEVYYPDTFLMTPNWIGNGNLANVDCEFTTDTVAKKIGRLITP